MTTPVTWHRTRQRLRGNVVLVGRCKVVIVLCRKASTRAFDAADEQAFARALDHTARALEQAARYASARQSAQMMAGALDLLPVPLAIIDRAGEVLFRNREAVGISSREDKLKSLAAFAERLLSGEDPPTIKDHELSGIFPGEWDGWHLRAFRLPDGATGAVVFGPQRPQPRQVAPELTDREREIAALVIEGLTNREIATALSISVNTVKRHLKNAFLKTNVRSRPELVAKLMKERRG